MIAKKKGLYLGLLLSMLGVGNAMQAWTIKIANATPFTIKYEVSQASLLCSDDHGELGAGHTIKINTKGCLTVAVDAWVYEKPGMVVGEIAMRKERLVKAVRYTSSGRGNGSFIVTGPLLTSDRRRVQYIVTRRVN